VPVPVLVAVTEAEMPQPKRLKAPIDVEASKATDAVTTPPAQQNAPEAKQQAAVAPVEVLVSGVGEDELPQAAADPPGTRRWTPPQVDAVPVSMAEPPPAEKCQFIVASAILLTELLKR
jgi:hypothetical protein